MLRWPSLWCQNIAPSFEDFATFTLSFRTLTLRRYKFFSLHACATTVPRTLLTLQPSLLNSTFKPSKMSLQGKAMNTMVSIKNRCPTKAFNSKTPQEAWSGRKPDVSHMRVFGCKAFAHVPNEKRTKLQSKSMPYVFLGYYEGTKAYRLMCLKTKRIIKVEMSCPLKGQKK